MGKIKLSTWLVATLVMAGLALFFAGSLSRQLMTSRPLPQPPAPRALQAVAGSRQSASAEEDLASYNVIIAKHLFNASRSEGTQAVATPAAIPLPPRPVLHGLVVDGTGSVAFLEDPSSKRTLGYRVGDSVAGGQLVQIGADRVLIRRSDGQLDVLLNDPGKVKVTVDASSPTARSRAVTGSSAPVRPPISVPVHTPRLGPSEQPPVEPQPQVAPPHQNPDD